MASKTVNNLTAEVRTETGKGASRRARRAGKVPAVLYGHGADPQHLLLSAHDFAAVLRNSGTNAVLTLDVQGAEQFALTKALEIHPIRRNIQHADLLVVRRGEKVIVDVNVILEGEPAPGAMITQDTSTIEIEAEALSIPDQLTLSIEGAEEGTQFLASQVPLPSGITLVSDPDMLVVNIVTPQAEEETEAEAAEGEAGEGAEGEGDEESAESSDE
ncbi:MAG: large subunit ribosomal protein [Mycobacterium sp.]|jgi:large subunit ribosomal protein L25|nr:large subunit ribosomal protein [Mycobacterium sp.]